LIATNTNDVLYFAQFNARDGESVATPSFPYIHLLFFPINTTDTTATLIKLGISFLDARGFADVRSDVAGGALVGGVAGLR
jgi:hypothetical protein